MKKQGTSVVVFVEIGRLPTYLWVALQHCRYWNSGSRIILATDQDVSLHPELSRLEVEPLTLGLAALEDLLPRSETFVRRFKRNFWYYTSLRFFALRLAAEKLGLSRFFHLESDYLTYISLEEIGDAIPDSCSLGFNCEPGLVIPGMLYFRDIAATQTACGAVQKGILEGKPDMQALYSLVEQSVEGVFRFPTLVSIMAPGSIPATELDFAKGVFDAAALGHRLAGTDRNPFRSWTSRYTTWGRDDLVYFQDPANCLSPTLRVGGLVYPVLGLHVHAKRLECLATFAGDLEPISGCRCLEWADWVACLNDGFAYASRVGLEPQKLLLVGENSPVPTTGSIVAVSGDEVYRLPENWLMRVRELGGLVFLVVNSDRDHEASALARLIGHKNIAFAQNLLACDSEHRNVRPLPIGVQNRIWPEINIFSSMTSRARKFFGVLSALSSTHRSRLGVVFWSLIMASRLPHLEKPLEIRVHRVMGVLRWIYRAICTRHMYGYRMPVNRWRRLLRSSFFVLSLRGNGADTHRFWEGQYHGAIPLLRPADDLPVYSGWPRLVRGLAPMLLRGIRQQDITEAMAKRDVRLIRGAKDYEREIRYAAKALGEIYPR